MKDLMVMDGADLSMDSLLRHLQGLADSALTLWDVPEMTTARLINLSENATYLLEAPGYNAVLRVHRVGYHTRRAIESELAWLDALSKDSVVATPRYIPGRDGAAIQKATAPGLAEPRFLVLFEFVNGTVPDDAHLVRGFEDLGAIAARCHVHAIGWEKPDRFDRLTWDVDTVFGPNPTWGDWRAAPGVTPDIRATLEQVEQRVRDRLAAYGKAASRFNLIHADMRLANLLVDDTGTRLIDFDDCGFGWLMYDFAAAISFIEDDPRIPDCKAAWLRGYQTVRALDAADIAEMDTLIMLRRMALLAWIGSHIEAPEPQALAPMFAAGTARLGRAWLASS